MGEATVPAEQPATGQAARVPAPDVDAGGTGDPPVSSSQRPRPPVGLIWRIRDRATFAAFGGARRSRYRLLSMTYVPASDGPPRVAFAISRKVGPAVVRNRVRRRCRAALARLPLTPGAYLIVASPAAATATFSQLEHSLLHLARSLGTVVTEEPDVTVAS